MRLVKQALRPDCLALGIYGTSEEIEGIELSLLNLGYINSNESRFHRHIGLHLGVPEAFRYVMVSPENLKAWLRYRVSLRFDCERIETPSLSRWVEGMTMRAYEGIETETFLHYGERYFRQPETDAERKQREHAKREIAELAALA